MGRFRGHLAAVVACGVALAAGGCAEGDSLFSDAGAVHSGRYERQLEESRQQGQLERTRGAALEQQNRELAARSQELDRRIGAEKKNVQSLKAKVAKLDRETRELRTASAESARKKGELEAQIAQVKGEIAALERQLAGNPSAAELDRLKKQLAELEQTYADLLAIYKSL
jgi:chromosome segregation ATPase